MVIIKPSKFYQYSLISLILLHTINQSALANQSALTCEIPQISDYDIVGCLENDLASVQQNGKSGFIDKTGNIIIPIQYDDTMPFSENLAPVKKMANGDLLIKKGNIIIPLQYDNVFEFSKGLAIVWQDGESFYINQQGQKVD